MVGAIAMSRRVRSDYSQVIALKCSLGNRLTITTESAGIFSRSGMPQCIRDAAAVITQFEITNSALSEQQLEQLWGLRHINIAVFRNVKFPTSGKAIGIASSHLYMLCIADSSINEDQVSTIVKYPSLKVLYLSGSTTPATTLNLICSSMAELEELDFSSSKVIINDLSVLRGLPKLHLLVLDDLRISGTGLGHFAQLKELHVLSLSGTDIVDEDIVGLSRLTQPSLDLRLARTRVTDRSIGILASLPNLKLLDIRGTSISRDGAIKLRKAIEANGGAVRCD